MFALPGLLALSIAGAACSPENESRPAHSNPTASSTDLRAPAAADAESGSAARDPRPSIILVVLDTTRADAISAYGAVEGTTPTVDALAAKGTLFTHAFAPSPWTVSSHASLFSGLRVDQHRVGLDGRFVADDSLDMVAESLREAGYQTAGFAENSLVSSDFGFDQGFDHFEATHMADVVHAESKGEQSMSFFGLAGKVEAWNRGRDRTRPFFLFINIMDAHDPYSVRKINRWVPDDADPSELDFVSRHYDISAALCQKAPTRRDQALLRGLYLGDVSAADQKLERVLAALGEAEADEKRITIVTSDHGEHLGEHRLSGHRFSVRTPALHVPLVVTGVASLPSGHIESAVGTRSLRSSILCWSVGEACPGALSTTASVTSLLVSGNDNSPSDTRPLDTTEPLIAIYSDRSAEVPGPVRDQLGIPAGQLITDRSRGGCTPDDGVFGDLVSLTRYPMKMNWFDGLEPTLHDLSWDPWERSNVVTNQREVAVKLRRELESFVENRIKNQTPLASPSLSKAAASALEALGYIE